MFLSIRSAVQNAVQAWIERRGFSTCMNDSQSKIFAQSNAPGLIENFAYRILHHLLRPYTDEEHFRNLILMTEELDRVLKMIPEKYADRFTDRPLAQSVFLY